MIVGWMFGRIVPLLLLFVVHYGSSFVYNVRSVQSYHGLKNYEDQCVLVRNSSDSQVEVNENLKAEGFEIKKDNNVIYINGYDSTGAMYGLLDIAETIKNNGCDAIEEKLNA